VIGRARREPSRPAGTLIGEDGSEPVWNARELLEAAEGSAAALQREGLGAGDIVILVMRHSRELVSAFWGALYLGATPSVFPFLSEKLDPQLYCKQVRALVVHSGARVVVAQPEFVPLLADLLRETDCRLLPADALVATDAGVDLGDRIVIDDDVVLFASSKRESAGIERDLPGRRRVGIHYDLTHRPVVLMTEIAISEIVLSGR
jgi:acyl-CoA synthetase (AMP-forming)/AMP-acid ligase II